MSYLHSTMGYSRTKCRFFYVLPYVVKFGEPRWDKWLAWGENIYHKRPRRASPLPIKVKWQNCNKNMYFYYFIFFSKYSKSAKPQSLTHSCLEQLPKRPFSFATPPLNTDMDQAATCSRRTPRTPSFCQGIICHAWTCQSGVHWRQSHSIRLGI